MLLGVGGARWSCIPNLLCHFNKLLSQSHDHTSALWAIHCFEEERERFHILHGSLSLCDTELPVVRESTAVPLSLLCSLHGLCTQKALV